MPSESARGNSPLRRAILIQVAQDPCQRGPVIDPRPPTRTTGGRGGINGSIRSQRRSSTIHCCLLFATADHDQRSAAQDHVATHLVLRPGLRVDVARRRKKAMVRSNGRPLDEAFAIESECTIANATTEDAASARERSWRSANRSSTAAEERSLR